MHKKQIIDFLRDGKRTDQWLTSSHSDFDADKMLARHNSWLPHMLADEARLSNGPFE